MMMVKKTQRNNKPGNFPRAAARKCVKILFFSDAMWYSWERTQNFAWEGIS